MQSFSKANPLITKTFRTCLKIYLYIMFQPLTGPSLMPNDIKIVWWRKFIYWTRNILFQVMRPLTKRALKFNCTWMSSWISATFCRWLLSSSKPSISCWKRLPRISWKTLNHFENKNLNKESPVKNCIILKTN